ncbi:MAG: triose-phosphate isomerase [Alphaproteobacteria bacterium]|nr:MAG: triose-phosphate isomerase [Alphaproteobacteria bacterium]
MAPKGLIAGNWKMNGLRASVAEIEDLKARMAATPVACDVLVCPPATLICSFVKAAQGSAISIGGQDCHAALNGAHTGDISAQMLADLGCSHVIVGHSERRADHGESDADVQAKAAAALSQGLVAIICVGETEAERDDGRTIDVVTSQIRGSFPDGATADNTVIAYEPVWAIGTGRTPTPADVAETHAAIRAELVALMGEQGNRTRILYGGSVKPSNASELLTVANVNGALVGGASLKAEDFWGIISACQ